MRGGWNDRRVVITGMGVIAPNGMDLGLFWDTIRAGKSAVGPIRSFDTTDLSHKLAAELKDFDPKKHLDDRSIKRMSHMAQFGCVAAKLALEDSGLSVLVMNPDRTGIIEGVTSNDIEAVEDSYVGAEKKGAHGISLTKVFRSHCGEGSSFIAKELGIRGHAITYGSGCASGNDVMGLSYQMIRNDESDVIVVGATDDPLHYLTFLGYCRLGAMSRKEKEGAKAMQPFDIGRDGFILGQGAAYVVMEDLSHALGRGAPRIYAEVLGHGRSCDAFHPIEIHPEGLGYRLALERCLKNSRLDPQEVDYVNAHATATSMNDPIETSAIKRVFQKHAYKMCVSGTKPVTGHMMGSCGAIETVVCALALHHREIPPTANSEQMDRAAGCDLDYVFGASRPYPIQVAINLNAGFGGKYACLALKRFEGA